jgi:TetR/AcrR family transcriptional regulator, regulator of cefoperazone and chloramphenicol sensitivity
MANYATTETTKDKLIHATGVLVAKVGLDNVSTRAVAELSGENIGSIHYHFGGKDGLFEAVILDAISWCSNKEYYDAINAIDASATTEEFSKVIRVIVSTEITDLFRRDRPVWHSQVIYQVLQRDDELYDMIRRRLIEPTTAALRRFLQAAAPGISDEEAFLCSVVMKMPIYGHANYMKMFLKSLGATSYSEEYLKKLEDLLVKQAQLSLGLPED